MINIKEVVWTNFLGYGDYKSAISFDDIKGACLIEGEIDGNEERDEGDEKLNAAGKTSIVEAITWGLFGSLTRVESPGDRVVNWHTGRDCRVSIKTNDGYEITRMRKYNGLTELLVFKDGEDVTRSTSVPAQEFINDTFGIEYHTFVRSRIFGQFSDGFLDLSDQKMRRVLESIMGIGDLSPIIKTAKNKVIKLESDIESTNAKTDMIDSEIDRINEHIDSLESKHDSFNEEINNEISEIRKEINDKKSDISTKIEDLHQEIRDKENEKENKETIDIVKLEKEWEEYNSKLSEYQKKTSRNNDIESEISRLKYELEHKKEILKNSEELQLIDIAMVKSIQEDRRLKEEQLSKYNDLSVKLMMIITELETKKSHEDEFINKTHGSVCPECRNKLDKNQLQQAKEKCQHLIADYDNKIASGNDKLDKLRSTIDDLENDINVKIMTIEDAEEHNNKVTKQKERIAAINNEIDDLSIKIDELESQITNMETPKEPCISVREAKATNDYINNISKEIEKASIRIDNIKKEFKNEISKANDRISKIKSKNSPYIELIREQRENVRSLEEEKSGFEKLKSEKKTLKAHVDYIRESYNNKRKIKAFWISELIPDFNRYLRHYLDFFEVDDKIEFDEYLVPKMNRWGYDTHSGGECKRIDLSIMFALSDLHTANFGQQSNFIVLDEVDGRVDPFTINKLVSLLSDDLINRNDGLTNIFIISHRKEMKDRFPNKIKVKNKQGRSYLVSDG